MKRTAFALAAAACSLWSAAAALAQGGAALAPGRLFGGAGLGVGTLSATCDAEADCDTLAEGAGLHAHAGVVVRRELAIIVDAWGSIHSGGDVEITNGIAVIGAQWWFAPKLWARGGVGVARVGFDYRGDNEGVPDRAEADFGLLVAGGYEVVARDWLTVDLQLRYGTGFYEEGDERAHSVSIGAGVTFF